MSVGENFQGGRERQELSSADPSICQVDSLGQTWEKEKEKEGTLQLISRRTSPTAAIELCEPHYFVCDRKTRSLSCVEIVDNSTTRGRGPSSSYPRLYQTAVMSSENTAGCRFVTGAYIMNSG